MLNVSSLSVHYGAAEVLHEVTIHVGRDELVTLIGGNGAGKTTLLRTISGILKPSSGRIEFLGKRIDGHESHELVQLGLIQVPQGRQLFPGLTVEENIDLGGLFSLGRNEMRARRERVYGLFSVLFERKKQRAGTLSGGEQQMLAIGRALMAKPKFLLLDEPSSGLAPKIVEILGNTIRLLRRMDQLAVLLVEQNAQLALGLSDRAYVLENGVIVASARASELSQNPLVRAAYLGL